MHWLILPPIGGLLILAGAALAGPARQADRVLMRFEVFGALGLHVVTNRIEIDEEGGRYAIVSDLATRGVAGIFVNLTDHTEVRGRLTADAAWPESFRSETRRDGVDRHDRVSYHSDGTVEGGASPPPLPSIATAQLRGTVDNLTAYFLVERRLALRGDCTFIVPVYEGRRRYDLRYADRGEQILSPAGGQHFSGATRACHMERAEIAGFPADPQESEGAREGMIWYSRLLPGDLMVPVRMKLVTEIGPVGAYLAELHGRGVDLQLME